MASLGEYLRQERERRGLSLDDVARVTRIRRQHLEALEADRFEDLPAAPFVRGFVSAYARQIGLAPDAVLARFQAAVTPSAQAGGTAPAPARAETGAPQSSGAPHGSPHRGVLVLVGLVAIGALAVLLARPAARPVRPAVAPVLVDTPVRVEPSPEPAEVAAEPVPTVAPAATPAATPRVAASPAKAGATASSPGRAEAGGRPGSPAVALPDAAPVPAAASETAPAAATAPVRRSTLSVSATEEAWVQVSIDGGTPVEATLKPGDRVAWQGATFDIVVGNAGGVILAMDGVALPPLGESGRRVALRLPRQQPPR